MSVVLGTLAECFCMKYNQQDIQSDEKKWEKVNFYMQNLSFLVKGRKKIICFRIFSGTLKGFIDKVCCVQEFLLSALPMI